MDIDIFIQETEKYLPIDYYDDENNAYKTYLIEALTENWENGKYQFSILAANMLYMSCIYKGFWFLKINGDSISYAENMKPRIFKNANSMFDLSEYPEKDAIYSCMKTLQIHVNDIDEAKALITTRNHCAHAGGVVKYNKKGAEIFFEKIVEVIDSITIKRKRKLIQKINKEFKIYVEKASNIKEFTKHILKLLYLSKKECLDISLEISIKNKNYQEECYEILLKYYLGKLSEDISDKDIDAIFTANIKGLLLKYSGNLEEIQSIFELDLDYECQQTWESVSFNEIKYLFSEATGVESEEMIDLNKTIDSFIQQGSMTDIDVFNHAELFQKTIGGDE